MLSGCSLLFAPSTPTYNSSGTNSDFGSTNSSGSSGNSSSQDTNAGNGNSTNLPDGGTNSGTGGGASGNGGTNSNTGSIGTDTNGGSSSEGNPGMEIEGVSLASAYINDKGELILVYTNGVEQNLGVVVGKDGNTDVTISGSGTDISYAVNKALKSAVRISCAFTTGSGFSSSTGYSAGSGVIFKIDEAKGKAFIVTNYHVVYESTCNTSNKISNDIKVYLYGAEYSDYAIKAEYIGGSASYDLAVIAIDSSALNRGAYSAADIANSNNVLVGDTAIAIGNPEGAGISATSGIVSVDSEHITVEITNGVELRVMRIDTPVNPGNSGGGLFDKNGNLIGIVNAKTSDTTIEGIGYAIPSNIVSAIANNIIHYCYGTSLESVQRPLLGITITTNDTSFVYNDEGKAVVVEEIIVSDVTKSGIAYGKILKNDIIKSIKIGDREIQITRQFHVIDFMLSSFVGDTVYTTVERIVDGVPTLVTIEMQITQSCITAS